MIRLALVALLLAGPAAAQTLSSPTYGTVTLGSDPANANQATRKSYLDARINLALPSIPACSLAMGTGAAGAVQALALDATVFTCSGGTLTLKTVTPTLYSGATASFSGIQGPDGTYLPLATLVAYLSSQGATVPGQVTGLTAGTITSTSVALSWTAPSGTPTGYSVCATPAGGTQACTSTGSTATSYTLAGLASSKAHTITVAGVNGAGTGAASASISATTLTAASYGTTYTATQSANSGTVNTAYNVLLNPGTGGWNGNAVSLAVSGAPAPATQTPTAGSATALTFAITPSAAGTVTATPSVSGMTPTPTTLTYTATAAAAYTLRSGGAGGAWPTSLTVPASPGYVSINAGIVLATSGGSATTIAGRIALGTSSSLAPVSGASGGDYGVSGSDSSDASYYGDQNGYPGQGSAGFYAWRNGRSGGATVTRYPWLIPTNGSIAPIVMTNTDGTPFAITLTFP